MNRRFWLGGLLSGALLALTPLRGHAAVSCEALTKFALPNARITTAETVAKGAYQLPAAVAMFLGRPGMNIAGHASERANPEFCRVSVTAKPSDDSDIRIELWLPASGWNGKLLAVGNFGWGGGLMYSGMLAALNEGYAAVSTDTGHEGAGLDVGGKFALGHPQKLVDYAYRADHEMTLDAKALVKAFYGMAPSHSYWIGCSLGGLEGLIEAKRYPQDYDGIVAGAPPNPLVRFNALQLWADYLIAQDASRLIPKDKYEMVHRAVVKACASSVGSQQGFVDEPDKCQFDPAVLQCRGQDGPDCLTAQQVYLLQRTYEGPRNPRTNELIFPGPARGSELGMFTFANGSAMPVALDLFRYAAFQDADWNWRAMDWDRDISAAIDKIGPLMHVDEDLKAFIDHGGRLLLYIGWNEYHNPEQLIDYYQAVVRRGGAKAHGAVRLFVIPGMDHCMGGAGCDTFDKLGALDDWVVNGKEPERIVAHKIEGGEIVRSRPLCAYPSVATYQGTGDIGVESSFNCGTEH